MASRCEAVAAHTAVIRFFVRSLTARRDAHYHIAVGDIGIVDYVAALHTSCYGAVYYDGAHQVAHVGGFATCGDDVNAQFLEFVDKFLRLHNFRWKGIACYMNMCASLVKGIYCLVGKAAT